MDSKVKEFLTSHRVSVLGILQSDSTIHSAALHFAYAENPLNFFFWTEKTSNKCASLLDGSKQNASLVIGFDEAEFATFQADGTVELLTQESDLNKGWEVYGKKFPDRSGGRTSTDMVLLRFTPSWWRYTDLKTDPKTEVKSGE